MSISACCPVFVFCPRTLRLAHVFPDGLDRPEGTLSSIAHMLAGLLTNFKSVLPWMPRPCYRGLMTKPESIPSRFCRAIIGEPLAPDRSWYFKFQMVAVGAVLGALAGFWSLNYW